MMLEDPAPQTAWPMVEQESSTFGISETAAAVNPGDRRDSSFPKLTVPFFQREAGPGTVAPESVGIRHPTTFAAFAMNGR
jgi:hypothetical protein